MCKIPLPSSIRSLSKPRVVAKFPSRTSLLKLITAPPRPSTLDPRRSCLVTRTNLKPNTGDGAPRATMASDEEYMSFLDKANQDLSDGNASSKSHKAEFKTTEQGRQAPKVIRDACQDAFYVTDADEPFHGVSLDWDGDGLPGEVEFAKLIRHWDAESANITIMDPTEWDARGQYTKLIDAVREATKGNDVRVYRVARDKTRSEYWVVSSEGGRIVGVKALGVES